MAGFARSAKLGHLILLGGSAFSGTKYGVVSSPTGFWIDHEGRIAAREIGFDPAATPREMEARIERMLAVKKALRK